MSDYERGPLLPYEVTWRSGYVERIMAHQVLWPSDFNPFGGSAPTPRVIEAVA